MRFDLKTIIALAAILLIATVGSAYVTSWVFSQQGSLGLAEKGSIEVPVDEPKPSSDWDDRLIWNAGSFTVNLKSTGPLSHYVKTSLTLGANQRETVAKMEKRRVQISDRIITILRTTQKSDLDTEEGIGRLKERIVNDINSLIVDDGGRVVAVYFSELVVQ